MITSQGNFSNVWIFTGNVFCFFFKSKVSQPLTHMMPSWWGLWGSTSILCIRLGFAWRSWPRLSLGGWGRAPGPGFRLGLHLPSLGGSGLRSGVGPRSGFAAASWWVGSWSRSGFTVAGPASGTRTAPAAGPAASFVSWARRIAGKIHVAELEVTMIFLKGDTEVQQTLYGIR